MSETFSFVDELEKLLPEMRAFARSLCKNPDLADDLVQDTCLKAWGAVDRFDPSQPMRPWLFRILRNEFYQNVRRAWRSTALEPEHAEQTLVASECLDSKSDFNVMQAAINELPSGQRDALILVCAGGFTYEEAGEICGCSDGTIKSRVSRAREAILHTMQKADKGQSRTDMAVASRGLDQMLARIDSLVAGTAQQAA